MTRESKLALIVGFSVMLLVGVLISDHLSRARTDGDAMLQTREQQFRPERGQPQQLALAPLTDPLKDAGLAPALPDPEPTPAQSGETTLASRDPVVLNQSWWSAPGTPSRASVDEQAEPLPDPQDTALARVMQSGADFVDRVRNSAPPAAAQLTDQREAQIQRPAPTLKTRPASKLPLGTHTVVKGDTLFSLASAYMGDGHRWREIKQLNESVLKGSDQLSLGMKLRIPGAGAEESEPEPKRKTTPGKRTYEVRPGDTLGEICQRELGTVRQLNALLAANSDKINDADDIRVGMVLVLPDA